jgi:hypothetical protein
LWDRQGKHTKDEIYQNTKDKSKRVQEKKTPIYKRTLDLKHGINRL